MKRKILLMLVLLMLLVGLGVTAVSGAPGNQTVCQDYGRLDYNYACRLGGWRPPCPDFGRLDYNYACQNGSWWPSGVR